MGLRSKAYFTGSLLAFYCSLASALGLGEIKLNSALNQPLDAEIQLLHVRDLTEREILVNIATHEDFQRAGVDRNIFLRDLQFQLDLNAAKGPVVRVTSKEPVKEPFLNFIVSARWPSGKLLREYTILVDLPVFSGARSAPVEAVSQSPVRTATSSTQPSKQERASPARSTPVRSEPPRVTSSSSSSSVSTSEYGPVGGNDTLWTIASKVRPDSSVSVQQTMLAIQRLNPEAFINGNINLLRRGQVLRLPNKEEIQQLSAREAVRQVAEQNGNWRKRSPAAEQTQAQLEGSKNIVPTRTESTAVEGRVKLSSPSLSADGQAVGSENGGGEGRVSEALTIAQEELDAADRENTDLKSRISSMEEQIQTMERLVEVSNAELRALELAATQSNDQKTSSESPAVKTAEETTEVALSQPQVEPEVKDEAVSEATPTAVPVTPPAQTKPSFMDLLKDNLLYIAAALGAFLLAIVGWLFARKRKEESEGFDEHYGSSTDDLDFSHDVSEEDDRTVPYQDADSDELVDQTEHVIAEAETEDVVSECDIHLAYAQYDQAEEKLLRALDKDPSNTAVRLKLLEVFAAQDDIERFDPQYAQLRALGDNAAIERAEGLRSSIQGAGEFDENAYDTSDIARLAAVGVAGAALYGSSAQEEEVEGSTADLYESDHLDFDIDGVDELVNSADSHTSTQDASHDSLDFDLELGDDDDLTVIRNANPDALADIDLELGDFSAENPDFSDLEFDLESPEDALAVSTDTEFDLVDNDLEVESEVKLTDEFVDNLVADKDVPSMGSDSGYDDLAFDDLEENAVSQDLKPEFDDMDFDLDRDIREAQEVTANTSEKDDFSFEDFGDLDDLETPALDTLGVEQENTKDSEDAQSSDDFELDFDLEKELNIDELDNELDGLESDFATSSNMEEPQVNFDELEDLDLDFEEVTSEEVEEAASENLEEAEVVALSTPPSLEEEFSLPDFDPENDDDSNLDFLSSNDEVATKLDLARAYLDMGDAEGAKDLLEEVITEGNDQQKRDAEALLEQIA